MLTRFDLRRLLLLRTFLCYQCCLPYDPSLHLVVRNWISFFRRYRNAPYYLGYMMDFLVSRFRAYLRKGVARSHVKLGVEVIGKWGGLLVVEEGEGWVGRGSERDERWKTTFLTTLTSHHANIASLAKEEEEEEEGEGKVDRAEVLRLMEGVGRVEGDDWLRK